MKKINHAVCSLIAAGTIFVATAHAQTVTISAPDSGNGIYSFGPGTTFSFGETLTVPLNVAPVLQSFTFDQVASDTNSSFAYRTYIYAYNPTTDQETGAALYTSGVETVPATGSVPSTITPGVTLTAGQSYIVLVTSAGLVQISPNSSSGAAGLDRGTGTYAGGAFVFNFNSLVNGFTSAAWFTSLGTPAAFTAVFGNFLPPAFSSAGLTSNQQAVLAPINNALAGGKLPALITSLTPLSTSPTALAGALNELTPLAFGQFTGTTAINNASFDTEGKDSYLASQRTGPNGTFIGGNGSIDASGLTVNDPSYDPNLAMVHSRLLAWNAAPASGTISDMPGPMIAGVAMQDPKDMKSMAAPAYSNPWNFYIQGNVVLAQGFSQPGVSHFDDNTESVTVGTDYRINPNFLVGLTAAYGHTDATLDNNGSSATVDSYSPGFYASYADKGWYANLIGNYTHNAYTQSREIGFLGETANSAPEGNEGVANLDGGYDFHHGALTFGPLVGVQYTHLAVDGYHETGSVADLSVNNQDLDSLRSRLGGRISFAYSHYGVVFTPHLDASWQHEFLDQSRGITSQFNDGVGSFSVSTNNPSRDSALVDAGVDAEINRTVTVFADYMVQAGQDDYFGQSIQGGVKIGF